MLSLPKFVKHFKVKQPVVYLWRILRYALPLFAAGIIFGLAPHFARIVI